MPEPVAMKLLQGYLWHPLSLEPPDLPPRLPGGASVAVDRVSPPRAFFENGEPTAHHAFYQLTVLAVYDGQPRNERLHDDALAASRELDPLLGSTDPSVGWTLSEDLRPA